MIAATVLTIVLLTPSGEVAYPLPQQFESRADCLTAKALAHAATRPGVSEWRIVKADCEPARVKK